MAPHQLRAMWAKRNNPQPTNPKLMDVRVAGAQPVRAVGPQPDIITRPAGTPVRPVARFTPPGEPSSTQRSEITPAFREWLGKIAGQRSARTPRPPVGVPRVLPVTPPPLVPRQHQLFNRAAAALHFLEQHTTR